MHKSAKITRFSVSQILRENVQTVMSHIYVMKTKATLVFLVEHLYPLKPMDYKK